VDISLLQVILLIVIGLLAGIVNTLAGGGSNLTLPALMILGMPADVANGTNRVGIVFQCIVGVSGFHKNRQLVTNDIGPILLPTVIGGLFGAVSASYAPDWIVKPLLLSTMLTMSFVILVRPSVVSPSPGTIPYRVKERPSSWLGLVLTGFYGGFVQAGVGFLLIAALAGTLRYDLVRTNALKMVCALAFTFVALLVFIARDQVLWVPGFILACGTMAGAHIAVKIAITAKPATLKWFLFLMTLCASVAAIIF